MEEEQETKTTCPKCGSNNIYRNGSSYGKKKIKCKACGKSSTIVNGTFCIKKSKSVRRIDPNEVENQIKKLVSTKQHLMFFLNRFLTAQCTVQTNAISNKKKQTNEELQKLFLDFSEIKDFVLTYIENFEYKKERKRKNA
jgi:hypothetical protein